MVPLNTRWSIDELRHAVADSGVQVMAVPDRDYLGTALELSAETAAGPGISWLLVAPQASDVPLPSKRLWGVSQWCELSVCGTGDNGNARGVEWRGAHGSDELLSAAGVASGNGRELDDITSLRAAEDPGSDPLRVSDAEDVFCVVHTSGSTGRSKGVALTHAGQVGTPVWVALY